MTYYGYGMHNLKLSHLHGKVVHHQLLRLLNSMMEYKVAECGVHNLTDVSSKNLAALQGVVSFVCKARLLTGSDPGFCG